MRIMQIITDYIAKSLLTTRGDMLIRGVSIPERLASTFSNGWLRCNGAAQEPNWSRDLGGATTHGDLIIRGADVCERLAAVAVGQVLKSAGIGAIPAWSKPSISDLGFKIGYFTRDPSGDEVVTGLGFLPKLVIFFCVDTVTTYIDLSWGFDDGTIHMCSQLYNNGLASTIDLTDSIHVQHDGSTHMIGRITARVADGFTVTFTRTGVINIKCLYFAIG